MNNVSNVQSESSSKTNKHLNVNKSVNGFRRTTLRIPTMTSRMLCFFCEKKDHYIWECNFLKNKKDEDGNANEAIVIKDIIAMVSDVCNKNHYISYGCNYKSFRLVFLFRCNVARVEVLVDIHNKAKVHGTSIVEVKLSFGNKFSWPMLYSHVPNIKKNQFVI